jgi:hypothetical protein
MWGAWRDEGGRLGDAVGLEVVEVVVVVVVAE